MTVSNNTSFGQRLVFFLSKAESREVRTTVTISPCAPISLRTPLASTDLLAERKRLNVASAEGGSSVRVCETVDAAASLKSEEWKQFGFLVSRKGEGVTDRFLLPAASLQERTLQDGRLK